MSKRLDFSMINGQTGRCLSNPKRVILYKKTYMVLLKMAGYDGTFLGFETLGGRAEGSEFKAILSYITNLKLC